MQPLIRPNENEAKAIDARQQELDLKSWCRF
jgi:hypothetical protein